MTTETRDNVVDLGWGLIYVERQVFALEAGRYRMIGLAEWTQRRGHAGRLVARREGVVTLEEPAP